jgi:hypothetical protein
MNRYYYSDKISKFLLSSDNEILGVISCNTSNDVVTLQRNAWLYEIHILKKVLKGFEGAIYFEYSIPRMGKRIDVLLIIYNVIFILEFKVGEKKFRTSDSDQVWDYALDLKNFHETSHDNMIAPILIATNADVSMNIISRTEHNDNMLFPILINSDGLSDIIKTILYYSEGDNINPKEWENGRYMPTPTIVEAAISLYSNHSVVDIARNDASAINLTKTSEAVYGIIEDSKKNKSKSICFITGVPGAGKTLVGLNIATQQLSKENNKSVYLSGNGPLVSVLREALTRDKVRREKEKGIAVKKFVAAGEVKMFIQNVHHYRDEYLTDKNPPYDHIAIFDEAQRAWDLNQTRQFMKTKKGIVDFNMSEPEFLISCLDRHQDWAVIICLVGGGQEINKGEAGISEWLNAINKSYEDWKVYISDKLVDSEYTAGNAIEVLENKIIKKEELHLAVSLRSFRAENLSALVKNLIDINLSEAQENYKSLKNKYPIVITRELSLAKTWLRKMARGSERYGIVVSSQAYRLKPHAIDVRNPINPIHWFLDGKDDVRSSYYLEDVATEFQIQGLELDWSCVTWDADLRLKTNQWEYYSFIGSRWNRIKKEERKQYLKNAYRVLLTRARQGMVIFVPLGDENDATRKPEFYNGIFEFLKSIGFEEI